MLSMLNKLNPFKAPKDHHSHHHDGKISAHEIQLNKVELAQDAMQNGHVQSVEVQKVELPCMDEHHEKKLVQSQISNFEKKIVEVTLNGHHSERRSSGSSRSSKTSRDFEDAKSTTDEPIIANGSTPIEEQTNPPPRASPPPPPPLPPPVSTSSGFVPPPPPPPMPMKPSQASQGNLSRSIEERRHPPPSSGVAIGFQIPPPKSDSENEHDQDSDEEIPDYLKPKKITKSKTALKKMIWKIVPPSEIEKNSFWAHTREEKFASSDLWNEINSAFAIKKTDATSSKNGIKIGVDIKQPKILDQTALQILSIVQGSIKMSYDDFRKAIVEMDETHLSEPVLIQLIHALPDQNQLADLQNYNPNELIEAEAFALKIGSISKLKPRLKAICFKLRFQEIVDDVKLRLIAVNAACDEVKNSNGFSKFLELVLLVGNYMNVANNRPEAFGFEMKSLKRLSDIKSIDQSKNLLQVLVGTFQKKHPEFIDFTHDFVHVKEAAQIPAEILKQNFLQIQSGIKRIESALKNFESEEKRDKFKPVMEAFLKEASNTFDCLANLEKEMQIAYADLGEYFSFNPSKYPSHEFFGDLDVFKYQYEHALKEITNPALDPKQQAKMLAAEHQQLLKKVMMTMPVRKDDE